MTEETTPIKPPSTPTFPALTTPSGSRIYNPFHEGYLDQLGSVTVTPGVFASARAKTPSRNALAPPPPPFKWSPEVQGDLFPTEIDENPTLQLKLQQILDDDVS